MAQCCNNKLYFSDNYCPECGDAPETAVTLHSAFSVDPTIIESFQGVGEPFTGIVSDTYYYVRSKEGVSSGYLWLTLQTEKHEEKKFNIQGETSTFQNIKVGDVLSVISPEGIELKHLPSRSDRKTVTHNYSPGIAVYHKEDDNNTSYVDPCISSVTQPFPAASSWWLMAMLAAGGAWGIFNYGMFAITSPWFIGACTFSVLCILLAFRAGKIKKQSIDFVNKVNLARSKLADVLYSQLGYAKHTRPISHEDRLCHSCHNAVSPLSNFCCHCGEKQNNFNGTSSLVATDVLANKANAGSEISVIKNGEAASSQFESGQITVREHNASIFDQYELKDQFEYAHKHSLSRHRKHQLNVTSRLVRVIDKKMGVNLNEGVHATTYKTEYKNRYGVVVDTKESTTYKAYRDVYLDGFLVIEDKDGNISQFFSNASLLSLTNIGDLILIGEATLTRSEKINHFIVFVYNLNKDKKVSNLVGTLETFSPSFPIMSMINVVLFPILLLCVSVGALNIGEHIGFRDAGFSTGLVILAIGGIYYFLSPILFRIQNATNKKRLLPALYKKMAECVKNKNIIINSIK